MPDRRKNSFDAAEVIRMTLADHHRVDIVQIDSEQAGVVQHDRAGQPRIEQNGGGVVFLESLD